MTILLDQDIMQLWALMVMVTGTSLHRSRFLNGMIRVAEVGRNPQNHTPIFVQGELNYQLYRKASSVDVAMPISIRSKHGGRLSNGKDALNECM